MMLVERRPRVRYRRWASTRQAKDILGRRFTNISFYHYVAEWTVEYYALPFSNVLLHPKEGAPVSYRVQFRRSAGAFAGPRSAKC